MVLAIGEKYETLSMNEKIYYLKLKETFINDNSGKSGKTASG